jgi:hypothetical protein
MLNGPARARINALQHTREGRMHGNLSSIIVIIVNEILLRPEANKNVIKP